MALSVNREIGIKGQSNIFAPQPSDFVKGDELSRVAREILTGAPRKAAPAQTADVKIFSQGAELAQVKQVATNRTGLDVSLSFQAQHAINGLKAMAAQNQVQNLSRVVDGKINFNAERAEASEMKSVFSGYSNNIEIFNTANVNKDRKGPGGFYLPILGEDEEEAQKEGINLVI